MRVIQTVKRILISLVVLTVLLCFGIYATLKYQDHDYAAEYFNFLKYEKSLESRKWHKLNEVFGCSYAVVSLPESSPARPPAQWLKGIKWSRTPLSFKKTSTLNCHNPICDCKKYWDAKTANRLEKALNSSKSFYYYNKHRPPQPDMGHGVIYVYSKSEGIAAMVRLND